MSNWIKCSDKLPEPGSNGLCAMRQYDSEKNPMVVVPFTFLEGQFHPFADEDSLEIEDYWIDPLYWPTHWMPLPDAPE